MSQENAHQGENEEPKKYVLDIEEIRAVMPHRFPMLLVDRILELDPGKRVVGLKNVTINEPFFTGHFPGQAVMPGALILEVMAQVACVMMLVKPEQEGQLAYLTGADKFRFRRPVVPGDTLIIEVNTVRLRGPFGRVRAEARVDGVLAAEGEIQFWLTAQRSSEEQKKKIDTLRQSVNGGTGNSAGGQSHGTSIPITGQGQVVGGEAGGREIRGDGGSE